MDWLQVLVLMGGNLALIFPLWLWNRAESRADNREIMNMIAAIQQEMKDFHGRLCAIEERNRK